MKRGGREEGKCKSRKACIGQLSVRNRSTANRCFAEIAAISLPTGDAKEESIAYACVLIERGCSSNCHHFACICNATSQQALSRKRRDSHKHIPECPIDGKKQQSPNAATSESNEGRI